MSDEKEKTIIKCLAAAAWADGRVDAKEQAAVEAVVESFGVDAETQKELLDWAKMPRTLDDVDVSNLSSDDAELLLHQAVLLSFADGEQSEKEVRLLNRLVEKLGMSEDTADAVMKRAVSHARALLPVLYA